MAPETILSAILGVLTAAFVYLVLYFVLAFLVPSQKLLRKLRHIKEALAALKQQADKNKTVVDPTVVRNQFMNVEPFKHIWSEYVETLHPQRYSVAGEEKLVNWRATVPAEMYFSTQVLVDTPLRTEFFKHLPGLFTGIGIIGTFSGLIVGLQAFTVSEDPSKVRASLDQLFSKVSHAFTVSAFAISAAMLVTFFEKRSVTRHYRQVEELCQIIDSLYTAGVGEEYLARLVKASEESATQTTQLKDSLVADLKVMMTNLVEHQIQATQASHRAMAANITQSLTESLREPMEAISRIVDRSSQSQGEAVQKALADVITGFMAKLEDVFGGQIAGMNALMQETTSSMRETRDRFAELVANLSIAGRSAGEAMGEQLTRAMEAAELRQREMNNQMRQFVEQIRELVSQSQSETSDKLHATLEMLSANVGQVINSLSEQQTKAGEESAKRHEALADHAQNVLSDLDGNINSLIAQTNAVIQSMKDSVTAMRNITAESMDKMNASAETLHVAALDFSKAGQGVTGVFDRANQVSEKLSMTATGLEAAARTVQLVVASYDKTRNDVTAMASSLQAIIESAKREAGVSQKLVRELEAAAEKFSVVQKGTEVYLDQVSAVLKETLEGFTDAMKQSLHRSRTEFDISLGSAVEMLRSTIEDLDDALAKLATKK